MRPTSIAYVRDGQTVPIELTALDGYDDHLEHWQSGTELAKGDGLHIEQLHAGTVIHFPNCLVIRPPDGGQVFLMGMPGSVVMERKS